MSSVHGHRASPYKAAYVSAKHGLEGLSKVIALEAAGKGVTSNTVCPGYVRTPLVEGQIAAQAQTHGIPESDVLDEVLLARTPVKRLVEPEEVADMVGFLCGAGAASSRAPRSSSTAAGPPPDPPKRSAPPRPSTTERKTHDHPHRPHPPAGCRSRATVRREGRLRRA